MKICLMFCSFALLIKASECLSYHFDDDDFSDYVDIDGGYSEVQPADNYIQSIADEVKCKVQKKFKGRKMYKAIEYEDAVAAGINYIIKLQLDVDEFVTIKVFKALMAYGGEAKFMGVMRSRDDQKRSYDPYKFGKSRAPNKKVQNMLNQFTDEIIKNLGLDESYKGHTFIAKGYQTQKAENGMFFQIGFDEDKDNYSEVTVFRGKDGKLAFREVNRWLLHPDWIVVN